MPQAKEQDRLLQYKYIVWADPFPTFISFCPLTTIGSSRLTLPPMYRMFRLRLWFPLLLCLLYGCSYPAGAQTASSSEAGLPYFIQHFSPHSNPQNWSIAQDSSGVIYVANNDGILVFDGVTWNLLRTPSRTIVRSLAIGPDDSVYAGQVGDFGVLRPDSTGALQFNSLTDEIPPENRSFDDVWSTSVTSDGVYFQASNRLFRWNGSTMRSWYSSSGYHTSFSVRDTLYVRIRNRGLFRIEDDSLELVRGGEQFRELHVFMMSPHGDDQILIGTRQEGLFLKRGQTIEAVPSEIASLFRERRAYHGRRLTDTTYAVGTLGGGVILFNAEGEVLDLLTTAYELPGGTVNYVYPDNQGGLWLALHNQGIARVDVPTPLTIFEGEMGPEGLTYSIHRHQQTLYAATGSGLYYLDKEAILENGTRGQSRFRRISGIPSAWSLLSLGSILLVASQEGIYTIDSPDENPRLISDQRTFTLRRRQGNPDRVLAGTKNGLFSLTRSPTGWQTHPVAPSITEEIRSVVQTSTDTLWLATPYTSEGRIIRLTVDRDDTDAYTVERFGQDAGLPVGDIRVSSVNDRPLFTASEGMFRFNPGNGQFVRQSPVPDGSRTDSLRSVTEGENGRLWMVYPDHVEIATPTGENTYEIDRPNPLRMPYSPFAQLYVEPTDVAWISRDHQMIRYDPAVEKDYGYAGRALIREIRLMNSGQTLLRAGQSLDRTGSNPLNIPRGQNSLQIDVAAPFYNRPEATSFQYQLSGQSEEWSEWQRESTYSFAELDAGPHQLKVRARSFHGVISRPGSINFRILPPWYQTWWAYMGYTIILGLGVAMSVRYRQLVLEERRAERQRIELERERQVNERLQAANERLQEANEWKDSLVSNTSHELRTPLAAILGFARVLRDELSGHQEEFIELIEANGERLQRTVDRLLNMSKLETGEIIVQHAVFDITECTHRAVDSLRPLAEEKNLDLEIDIPEGPIRVRLDNNKFEEIVYNLTGNAIKFTNEGHIRVSIEATDQHVSLIVEDTGIGMSEEFLSEMFESFTQESTGLKRTHEGTGLGLFITRRLVELMDGDIEAQSTKGEGTTFTVTFPRQVEHS